MKETINKYILSNLKKNLIYINSTFLTLKNFLDYKFIFFFIILWVLIYIIPGFIPDYLNIRFILENSDIISIMLSIIASLFGILIAFLLISFGLFRDKFGRIALKYLSEENNLKFLINLLLFVTTHLLICYLLTKNNKFISDKEVTLAYFSIFIFFVSLFLLFPISYNALSSPDSLENIDKRIHLLTKEKIIELYNQRGIGDTESATKLEENELIIIQKLGISLIKNDDKIGFVLLLTKLNDKHLELIGSSKDTHLIGIYYQLFTKVWNNFILELLKIKASDTLINFWIIIEKHHRHFADNRIPLANTWELDFFIKSFIDRLFSANEDSVLQSGITKINIILEYHFKNSVPPQEKISSLMDIYKNEKIEYESDIETQWGKISHEIPYYYVYILRKCIEYKNENLFTTTLHHMDYLLQEIIKDKMGEFQKDSMLHYLMSDYFYYQIEAIRKGLINDDRELRYFDTNIAIKSIENNSIYKRRILSLVADFQIELLRLGKFDMTYQYRNFFSAIGRFCSNKIHMGESYKESMYYILKFYKHLKKDLEKDLKTHGNNYYLLKSQIESIRNFHFKNPDLSKQEPKSKELIDKKFIKHLNKLIDSFVEVKKPDLQLGQNIIKWD